MTTTDIHKKLDEIEERLRSVGSVTSNPYTSKLFSDYAWLRSTLRKTLKQNAIMRGALEELYKPLSPTSPMRRTKPLDQIIRDALKAVDELGRVTNDDG